MKKLLVGLVILVLSVVFLVGCDGTIIPQDDVFPLALIREYVGG